MRVSPQAGALIRSRRVMQACADIERGRVCSAWWSYDACDPHYINGCNACDGLDEKAVGSRPWGVDPKRSASGDVEGMPCGIGDVPPRIPPRPTVVKISHDDRYEGLSGSVEPAGT